MRAKEVKKIVLIKYRNDMLYSDILFYRMTARHLFWSSVPCHSFNASNC